MLIRLYSNESKPHKIICNPSNNEIICGEIKSTKCIKRKSFFSFDYIKEKEDTLDVLDTSFYFNIWMVRYPISSLGEPIKVGKLYWTTIGNETIEWNITDRNKLNDLRNYILENYQND